MSSADNKTVAQDVKTEKNVLSWRKKIASAAKTVMK